MAEAAAEDKALSPFRCVGQRHAKILCALTAALLVCWRSGNVIKSYSPQLPRPSRLRRLQQPWNAFQSIFGSTEDNVASAYSPEEAMEIETDPRLAFQLCMPLKDKILELNSSAWPLAHLQPPPGISRIVYMNLNQDAARAAWAQQELRTLTSSTGSLFDVWRWNTLSSLKARADDWYEPFRRTGFARRDFVLQGMEEAEFMEASIIEGDEIPDSDRRLWAVAAMMFSHWLVISSMAKYSVDMAEDNEIWLVIDDNAKLPSKLYNLWQLLWPFVPEDWDVLHLGAAEDRAPDGCPTQFNGHLEFAVRQWNMEEVPCKACKKALAYIINPKNIGKVLWRFMHSKINHVHNLLSAPTPPGEDPDIVPPLNAFNVHPTLVESIQFQIIQEQAAPLNGHARYQHGHHGPHRHR